ncbi:alpha/beta hydrolase, partial [Myxococcus fulvus]
LQPHCFNLLQVFGLLRNRCSACPGEGVRLAPEKVIGIVRSTQVDFDKEDRAPLLFIAGSEDNIMPASLNKSNARHYNSGIVSYKEFPGRSHYICGQEGWEEVADHALSWALNPTA